MLYQKEYQALRRVLSRYTGMVGRNLDSTLETFGRLSLVLCGGTINSVFTGIGVNDLDFYCKDKTKLIEASNFLASIFNKEDPFITENAISMRRQGPGSNRVYPIQLITRFSGECKDIFDWFDFTVVMGAFDFEKMSFVLDDRFLPDIAQRVIIYGGKSMFPICAMYRTLKYQKKGYKLKGSTIMHIALSIVRLKIVTYKDLKEQLMGVDTMYLQGLLNNTGLFLDSLPVDYGLFLAEAFASIDGFSAEDEREENEG